jgi:signal transduction histidine kinase
VDTQLLKQLLDVSRQMAETRDLDPLLHYAMDIALELFDAERGYLVLVNRDATLDFPVKRDRRGRDIAKPEAQISTTILQRVVTDGKAIVTASAMEEFDDSISISDLQLRSVVCVPLTTHNHVIGALYLENRSANSIFSKKALEPLEFFASLAAVSIENAMLNAELEALSRERAEDVRTLNEIFQHQALERGIVEKRVLEEVLERERTRVIANFIQDASHHFRTPLAIINTNVDIVNRKMGENPYTNYFASIRGQVNAIVDLVDTLNYMVNLDSVTIGNITRLDLNDIAREMVQVKLPSANQKRITMGFEAAESAVYISGNLEYVRQALGRLLDNAITFTPERGKIQIRVYDTPKHQIIEVDDNGAGIATHELPHIFKRFYRTDKAGTTRGFGLGLSIVQRIMELHEGAVDCHSEIDKGSIFRMIFPKGLQHGN